MSILNFIFLLGINFAIFGFIWGIFKLILSFFIFNNRYNNQIHYILRIIKYFFLVSVTANFIMVTHQNKEIISSHTIKIVVGSMVIGLYLLGKLQKRAIFAKLSKINSPFVKKFGFEFDPKIERFLILGSITYFIFALLKPEILNNKLINWLTETILEINNTPLIGFIFKVIGFFILINILFRAFRILNDIFQGKKINEAFSDKNSNIDVHYYEEENSISDEYEYTDYEEVDEDEDSIDENNDEEEKNR